MKGKESRSSARASSERYPENLINNKGYDTNEKGSGRWPAREQETKTVRFAETDPKDQEKRQNPRKESQSNERPFGGIKPVQYEPLRFGKRLGGPQRENEREKRPDEQQETSTGPAYRAVAPIERETSSSDVVKQILDSTINSLTLKDILSLAPGPREELKRLITKKRVSSDESEMRQQVLAEDSPEAELPGLYDDLYDEPIQSLSYFKDDDLPRVKWSVVSVEGADIQRGSLVIQDPIVQFFDTMSEVERDKQVYIAHESKSLRTIYALINGSGEEECVLDGGSQIVSMHEAVSHELGISYDPEFKVKMQSANNQIESTVGLARNVPFRFGSIVLHMQVHILKNPPYKVLLGRPFDCLTESRVQNWTDGGQTVTITDPQTREKRTLPTFERGAKRILKKNPEEDFQVSRN